MPITGDLTQNKSFDTKASAFPITVVLNLNWSMQQLCLTKLTCQVRAKGLASLAPMALVLTTCTQPRATSPLTLGFLLVVMVLLILLLPNSSD